MWDKGFVNLWGYELFYNPSMSVTFCAGRLEYWGYWDTLDTLISHGYLFCDISEELLCEFLWVRKIMQHISCDFYFISMHSYICTRGPPWNFCFGHVWAPLVSVLSGIKNKHETHSMLLYFVIITWVSINTQYFFFLYDCFSYAPLYLNVTNKHNKRTTLFVWLI